MSNERGSGIVWFLTGVGIGTALGVLYAPRSGKETSASLGKTMDEAGDSVRAAIENAKGKAEDILEQGLHYVGKQKDEVLGAYEAGVQTYRAVTTHSPGAGSEAEESTS